MKTLKKFKIGFYYDLPVEQEPFANDGLMAAMRIVGTTHSVEFINLKTKIVDYSQYDFNLFWGYHDAPILFEWIRLGLPPQKLGLVWAGAGPKWQLETIPFSSLGVVFVEDPAEVIHENARYAFGVNTQVYKPLKYQRKIFDCVYPAAVAYYKRPELFALATSNLNAAFVGPVAEWPVAFEEFGVTYVPWMPPEAVNAMMNASYCTLITARDNGGSGRTMLESLAANVPVIIMEDTDRLKNYAKLFREGVWISDPHPQAIEDLVVRVQKEQRVTETRKIIEEMFSEQVYARQLLEGINACLLSNNTKTIKSPKTA